ncbi:hypothetical protein ACKS0A_07561 [Histoplasma ohiense]
MIGFARGLELTEPPSEIIRLQYACDLASVISKNEPSHRHGQAHNERAPCQRRDRGIDEAFVKFH